MNPFIETLNLWGERFLDFAWPMLWQSSLLITVLFALDLALRRRVRAAVRYALWLVVLVKLLLPPSLALPTGLAWWLRPGDTPARQMPVPKTSFVVTYPDVPAIGPFLAVESQYVPPPPRLSLAAWAICGWTTIGVGLFGWLLLRWRLVARDVRRATPAPDGLNDLIAEAKRPFGWHRPVRMRLTESAMSPAVCGLFRPIVLLPRSLAEQLPPAQLRAVLLHELIHLRRGDVWVNCAQALLQIVYWWHPLFWLANARIRRVREEAVDDAVMLALRDESEAYAPTLIEVAKLAFDRPLASLGLVGILESRSALRQRVERLVDFHPPRKAGLTIASALCVLAFAAIAAPMGEAPARRANQFNTATPHAVAADFSATTNVVAEYLKERSERVQTQLADQRKRVGVESIEIAIDKLLVQDAQGLYEAGRLDEAEAKLNEAIAVDPENKAALAYLSLVKEARYTEAERRREESSKKTIMETNQDRQHPLLQTRIYRVDPNTFFRGLEKVGALEAANPQTTSGMGGSAVQMGGRDDRADSEFPLLQKGGIRFLRTTNSTEAISNALRRYFTGFGVNLDPTTPGGAGKNVFFSDRATSLFVRATLQDLDIIERAVQVLNTAPPQINVKAEFFDLPESLAQSVLGDLHLTNSGGAGTCIALIAAPLMEQLRKTLKAQRAVDLLATSEVTTLSGRQAQIRSVDMMKLVSQGTNLFVQTNEVPVGPILDVLPALEPDGFQINMVVAVQLTEFIGYDDPGKFVPSDRVPPGGVQSTSVIPMGPIPHFRVRQAATTNNLWDGQTLVLGGLMATNAVLQTDKVPVLGDLPLIRPLFRSVSVKQTKKALIVFVTPTLIDPAGNRLHSDDELPFAREGVPPQIQSP